MNTDARWASSQTLQPLWSCAHECSPFHSARIQFYFQNAKFSPARPPGYHDCPTPGLLVDLSSVLESFFR